MLAPIAKFFTSAAGLTVFLGAIYTVDCRVAAGNDIDLIKSCYITGIPMMGLGTAALGSFSLGYNTLNPDLPRPGAQPRGESFDPYKNEEPHHGELIFEEIDDDDNS